MWTTPCCMRKLVGKETISLHAWSLSRVHNNWMQLILHILWLSATGYTFMCCFFFFFANKGCNPRMHVILWQGMCRCELRLAAWQTWLAKRHNIWMQLILHIFWLSAKWLYLLMFILKKLKKGCQWEGHWCQIFVLSPVQAVCKGESGALNWDFLGGVREQTFGMFIFYTC